MPSASMNGQTGSITAMNGKNALEHTMGGISLDFRGAQLELEKLAGI